jgi:hypothetical protein
LSFLIFFSFHIEYPSFHMDLLTNHMSRDIYKACCQYFFIKNIRDNHGIYNLIIIIIARTILNVRCAVSKMSKMNHLTMFLPFYDLRKNKFSFSLMLVFLHFLSFSTPITTPTSYIFLHVH